MALLPTQNALPKLCWNTPQPEDTLSELRQLKLENPLFYLTLNTQSWRWKPNQDREDGSYVQLVHSRELM